MDVQRLFSFTGRVSRQTFWLITLAVVLIEVILGLLAQSKNGILIALAVLIGVVVFVVQLATQVKRWHDRDKSGWWVLISLVPVIGGLWMLIELGFLPGTPGPNRFGNPASGSSWGR